MRNLYIDSSAILKYIFREIGSEEVHRDLEANLYSSAISRVEVIRAVLRKEPSALERAELVFAGIRLITLNSGLLTIAERLPHRIKVRGLDALHIASAQKLDREGHTIVTYDIQMAKAAKQLGFNILSPGVTMDFR